MQQLRCQVSHSGGLRLPIHGSLTATSPDLLLLRDLASKVSCSSCLQEWATLVPEMPWDRPPAAEAAAATTPAQAPEAVSPCCRPSARVKCSPQPHGRLELCT